MSDSSLILADDIQKCIYTIRGLQVMLDEKLAELYGVETRVLNQAVKRNLQRFPAEFMFQLTETEWEILRPQFANSMANSIRSQNVTLKNNRGQHRKYLPYVFTEQGIAMLSAVLRSETAVKVSVQIMNAFVAMRRFLISNAQVFQRLDSLELRQAQTDQKVKEFKLAHDRFLIIDEAIYHIGASLKDLGKKWFAFSKMEIGAVEMLGRAGL